MTSEENKQATGRSDIEKATKSLKILYTMFRCWAILAIGGIAMLIWGNKPIDWLLTGIFAASAAGLIVGIRHNKRITKGQKPL